LLVRFKKKIFCLAICFALLLAVAHSELIVSSSIFEESRFASPMFRVRSFDANSSSGYSFATIAPTGLSPSQVRMAYNLPSTGGSGTIAIIDAYEYPTAQNDFVTFSNQYGLPSTNFETYKLGDANIVDPGWALEAALDVQWAHAIAPDAKILLVQAKSNSFGDLLDAVSYATHRSDVVAVSMSWGGAEFSSQRSLANRYFTSDHGIVFFASSGDEGSGVMWPSTSSNVVAVGGTTLSLGVDGSVISETGWSGSGGGISAYEAEPSYQVTYGVAGTNNKRAVPDVSFNANPLNGFSVYDSTPFSGQTGWFQLGGTSAGSPQWAAIHSLGLSISNNNMYSVAKANSASYFRDITLGSNGGFSASAGFDFVTGLGSPLTFDYAPNPNFLLSAFPSNLTAKNRSSGNSTLTVTSINNFTGAVNLSVSLPIGWSANFTPSSINVPLGGNASAVLSLLVDSAVMSGSYQIGATGTASSLNHTIPITVNVQTVPSSPQNLNATAHDSQIILNWTQPIDFGGLNITGYNVYRGITSGGETKIASTIGNVINYVDNQILVGQVYYYKVTANNSQGESPKSGEVNATLQISTLTLLSFVVQNGGSGYTTPAVLLIGGGGSGAAATARVSNGVILGIVLTNTGVGYISAPSVVFRDPSPRAKGADAIAVLASST
jgi:subtilase family serine protease